MTEEKMIQLKEISEKFGHDVRYAAKALEESHLTITSQYVNTLVLFVNAILPDSRIEIVTGFLKTFNGLPIAKKEIIELLAKLDVEKKT